MKRLIQSIAGLCVAVSLAGCCFSPGYVDSCSGVAYGGGLQPCAIPDPFALLFGCGYWGGYGYGGYGCGSCGVAAASCTPACGPTCGTGGCVSSYGGGIAIPPATGTIPKETVPSVPAGVYEEAAPKPQPTPPASAKMGSIIYQTRPVSGQSAHPPVHDARNQRWVPARL